ncbi:DUF1709-domain-containing protein [Sporormia fimetaria CBS 119925]|uniref:DUF1709-domain-containing protein n=1 Tax=Sporormia fimetaria CBS 119925 TaxID=1340428 RepID=A0A6A6VPC5_9PLEO|nr:DUF1709-domain-containing protein [Sporormia fimetaria CBS 119925]
MSENEGVSPLRINKTPVKAMNVSRPLSEIGTTEHRRNSPSFNQQTKSMMFSKENSPFGSSPFEKSPRLFWKEQTVSPKGRFGSENDYENEPSPLLSPKRSSIENLKKASRVKNSNMFLREQKHEYDPASVQPLDRPLAAGRPLSTQFQGAAFSANNTSRKQNDEFRTHRRGESLTQVPMLNATKTSPTKLPTQSTFRETTPPVESRPQPTKSSLASPVRFRYADYNPDSSVFSDEDDPSHPTPRPLRRHAKSVTFDAAPPVINEYEMVTPDPSSIASGSREGSYDSQQDEDMSFDQDDSFDASLEDTEKTPVVLPEDWRHMSPDVADVSLTDTNDDVFNARDSSPMPNAPTGRNGSTASDGDSRPLPPLPPTQSHSRDVNTGLAAAAERASGARRSLPQLPQLSGFSKEDLLNMREGSMTLEDRLDLMNIGGDRDTDTPTQQQPEKSIESGNEAHTQGAEKEDDTVDSPKAPRISRESILRKVKSRNFNEYDSYDYDAESSPERSYGDLADLDPDVPIPSRECSSNFDEHPREISAPPEGYSESVLDAYSLAETTEAYTEAEAAEAEDTSREGSVIHHPLHDTAEEDDDASHYSTQPDEQPTSQSTIETSGPSSPAEQPSVFTAAEATKNDDLFASFQDSTVDLSLDPLRASFETAPSPLDTAPKIGAMREFLLRPETPESMQNGQTEEPGTPESVIRHPSGVSEVDVPVVDVEPPRDSNSPVVPEEFATIKGAGGKLKTRPSLIPEDVDMAETRRQVSGQHPPPVPERSPKRQSLSLEVGHVSEWDSQLSLKSSTKEGLILDIDIGDDSNDLSFGLDKEFDHIIEAQKKGYLMRQNTKLVVASSRQFSDEKPAGDTEKAPKPAPANSRKTSAERKPAWTTEPWNGKHRRRSLRTASGARRVAPSGPAPPLPGQESAVAGGLDSVEEANGEELEDGTERGRLFVKVVGVKDLDLPLPKTERTHFQLTLDNGLHCVTTSWLELGHSAPIGQEFELVVLDDLEFQLTLQTKLEPPAHPEVTAAPVVRPASPKKTHSGFRSLLSSPKKRKEQERKQQEEAERAALQQQQEAQAKRKQQPTAWDLLHNLVGPDGSFARAYVCLKNHENDAYGRLLNVDIPCFNEWAVDDSGVSSVKSKRGGVVRRPPYRVGKLALQLLYVPKPKNATDDDMPKSMNACIRELREAEQVKGKQFEGHLSQQGGDCPYWRRRYFRLDGTTLTAFHETTRQPRATINLAKAKKLIDDKTALQKPSQTKGGHRRRSAFAEDEEGYMFVEEGFRIRFANGEVIDFYADTTAQKEEWMSVLSEIVGKDVASGKAWTEMVLQKERREKMRAQKKVATESTQKAAERPQSHQWDHTQTAPTSPIKGDGRGVPFAPPPANSTGAARGGHSRMQSDVPPRAGSPTKGHSRNRSDAPAPPPVEKDQRHRTGVVPKRREVPQGQGGRRDQNPPLSSMFGVFRHRHR